MLKSSLDINSLVGNRLPVEIPTVVVKWITYALFLHVVALILAAGSAVFGLLAHVREMSMACCSTCVSGFAAAVAMLAFVFDLVLFFVARARINAVGSAEIGIAIWLTLAAWVLLFFSGCFYTLGRCCISKRGPRTDWDKRKNPPDPHPITPAYSGGYSGGGYGDQLRLDAVKAEADRKAHQKKTEVGLPAFYETQPLTGHVEGEVVHLNDPYQDKDQPTYGGHPAHGGGYAAGGYAQAAPGTRAVDEYYHPTSYPPQPQRQPSSHTSNYTPSVYAPSTYPSAEPNRTLSPPPIPGQGLTPHYGNDAYGGREYGHTAGGTSYHSATSHQQQPTGYSQYDAYDSHQHASYEPQQPRYQDPYGNNTHLMSPVQSTGYNSHATSYYSANSAPPTQPERQYTLGGDGYGANTVPDHTAQSGYYSPPIDTQVPPAPGGPRSPDDNPPVYDAGNSGVQGNWGKQ